MPGSQPSQPGRWPLHSPPPFCPPPTGPPSLRGCRRVSAARRPGNAADAPRSIPGGGSTSVLPHGRPGLGWPRSRHLAWLGWRPWWPLRVSAPTVPCPFSPALGSSTGRGVALLVTAPGARRDLLLLKPESHSASSGAGRPSTRGQAGGLGVSSAGRVPPALRLRLQSSPQARRSFRFPVLQAASC